MRQPDGLISVLLDGTASLDERDDAAMDLHAYDEPQAEGVLFSVAVNPATAPVFVASCGESLGEIWSRRTEIPVQALHALPPQARDEAAAILDLRRLG
jgi:hypothetical protein